MDTTWRIYTGVVCALSTVFILLVLFTFVDTSSTSDSNIYSAIQLYADDTGNYNDTDIHDILHFVVSDMGGKWTYRELEQQHGNYAMNTMLFYRPGYSQEDRIPYNTILSNSLPSIFNGFKSQSFWAAGGSSPGSCICGNNGVNIMQILYGSDSKMQRVSVVAHEYYHVLQKFHCKTVYDDRTHFVMWLSEGVATVFQNLYLTYWLSSHPDYRDYLFDINHGHVKQMIDMVQSGSFTYDSSLNTHDGALNNYKASTTAVLYLMSRKDEQFLEYIMTAYLFSGDCDLAVNGGMDEGFRNAFGLWNTVDSFYSDINVFLQSANYSIIETLRPSSAQINTLFNHTDLCSDICVTSRNGVCDSTCKYGSDCTDCGRVPLPSLWPITFGPEYHNPQNNFFSDFYRQF